MAESDTSAALSGHFQGTVSDARLFCVAFVLVCAALLGCAGVPEGRSPVDTVSVRGAKELSAGDLEDVLATTPSPKLFGLFRGVAFDYQIYDYTVLQRDLARVERFYRAHGFYEAHARAGRVTTKSDGHVDVQIVVEEGPPIKNHDLSLKGLEGLPPKIVDAVTTAVRAKLPEGDPFDEEAYTKAETDAKKALTDNGYAYAKVDRDVFVDIVKHTADVSLAISPDKPAVFGKVTIDGLVPDPRLHKRPLPDAPLRRAIDIQEGTPYSTALLDEAAQALLDLEVLSSVEVTPDLTEPPPEPRVVNIHVKVEPSQLKEWTLGGGVEFDELKTDLHGVIGWEDHNFFGGLRDFTINFQPGVVLYPTRLGNIVPPDSLLPEGKLRLQLRQPGFLEARTHGYIRPELNVFPLLVKTNPGANDPVVGYGEAKLGTGLDRNFGKHFFASIGHNLQVEAPFSYKGTLDASLKTLVISYPSLVTTFDFRDDRIHTHKGIYISNELQVAGGPFGGDAEDIKVQPEVRTYIPLAKGVTFATRGSVGFLLSQNYGDVVQNQLSQATTDENRAARVRDIETVFFRGFFSGGSTSNRGFPIRGIAPHGVVPFLNPATASQQVALNCDPTSKTFQENAAQCSIPIGGFTLWEFSNELRFTVSGPLHAATFCDMSDVSPKPGNIRLDHLHMSCGVGLRYDTPVGPIRLDVGYRIQPLQVLGYANESAVVAHDPTEGIQPTILGIPMALAFGIGEAY